MTANHETYLLMASTQNDMEDWVRSIRRVIWAPFGGGESLREHAVLTDTKRLSGVLLLSLSHSQSLEVKRRMRSFQKSGVNMLPCRGLD